MKKNKQQPANLNEQFFKTVTTIVDESIKDLGYNITKICKIIDDSEKEYNRYVVQNGTLTLNVVDDNDKNITGRYKIGDMVRVTVPNGDYNEKIVIEGDYSIGNNQSIIYVNPKNHFVPMIDNQKWEEKKQFNLNRNNENNSICNFSELPIITEVEQEYFNSIYVKFNLSYDNYNLQYINGLYTIKLILTFGGVDNKENEEFIYNSQNIIGDPYNNLSMPQDVLFTTKKDLIGLSNIEFVFETDKQFMIKNDILPEDAQITIDSIEWSLGHEYTQQSGLKLFTFDTLDYGNIKSGAEKNLRYIWYNSDENGNFIGLSEYDSSQFKIPDNLDDFGLSIKMNECLMKDKDNKFPKDEFGLKLQVMWQEADMLIKTLTSNISEVKSQLKNLKNNFNKIYNYKNYGNPTYEINTKKMLYWLKNLEEPMKLIWEDSVWREKLKKIEKNTNFLKKYPQFDKMGISSSSFPKLYAPRVGRTETGDGAEAFTTDLSLDGKFVESDRRFLLIKKEQVDRDCDFFLSNGVNLRDSNDRFDIIRKGDSNSYPGAIINKYYSLINNNKEWIDTYKKSEDSNLILRVMGTNRELIDEFRLGASKSCYFYTLKKYLIKKDFEDRKIKRTYYERQDKTTGTWYVKWDAYEKRWDDHSKPLKGRAEWNELIRYPRIMDNLISLHNRRVVDYEKWNEEFNKLNIYFSSKETILNKQIESIEKFQKDIEMILCAAEEKQNGVSQKEWKDMKPQLSHSLIFPESFSRVNILDLANDINDLAEDLNEPLSEIFKIPFDSNLKNFYDSYIKSIVDNINNINTIYNTLINNKYLPTAAGLDSNFVVALQEYYDSITFNEKKPEWQLKSEDNTFFMCLLQNVENTTNPITKEKGWQLVYQKKNIILSESLLPTAFTEKEKFFPVNTNSFLVKLKNSKQQQSTAFKLIIVKNNMDFIESNILKFNNIVNFNLFTVSPHIRFSYNTKKNHYALVSTDSTPIELKLQCYDDEFQENPINCYSSQTTKLPNIEFNVKNVFSEANGKRVSQYLQLKEIKNKKQQVSGIQIGIQKNKLSKFSPKTPLFFSVTLKKTNKEKEEGFLGVPMASHGNLLCSGTKILIFDKDVVYQDFDDESYQLILSTTSKDKILTTTSVSIRCNKRSDLSEVGESTINKLLSINKEKNILEIISNNYSSFKSYLFTIIINAVDEMGNKYWYKQPLMYFNKSRFNKGWEDSSIPDAFLDISNDNTDSGIDYSDTFFSQTGLDLLEEAEMEENDNEEAQQQIISVNTKNRNKNIATTNATFAGNLKENENENVEVLGKSFISPEFPYFHFYCNNFSKILSINPEQDPPIKLMDDYDGIELYYDGTIKFLKQGLEPLSINYQEFLDGSFGVKIQQIGVIDNNEIISTCD